MDVDYKGFLGALGARIKELRKQRGWSNRDMVVVHQINDSQWRKYERGGGLTVESMLRIAALFELSLSELLNGLGEYPAKSLPGAGSKAHKPATRKTARTSTAKARQAPKA